MNRDQSQLNKLRTVSLRGRNVTDTYVDIAPHLPALRELDLSVRELQILVQLVIYQKRINSRKGQNICKWQPRKENF